jgi:hypothetical protein
MTRPTIEGGVITGERSTQSFAARPLRLGDNREHRQYLRELAGRRFGEIAEGWTWYHRIGEVRYAIERSAKIAGYMMPIAQKMAPDGTVEEEVAKGAPAEAAAQFFSKGGGVRGLVERFFVLMKIPAESWLIREEDGDGFFFLSSNELDVKDLDDDGRNGGDIRWVTAPSMSGRSDAFHKTISAGNVLGRVWAPGRDYYDLVNSPMPALSTECQVLDWLTLMMLSRLKNRYALNGITLVPTSMNTIAVTGTDGKVVNQGALGYLVKAAETNIQTAYGEAGSASSIFMQADAKDADAFKHVMMDSGILEVDIKLRAELIDRILDGLDVQKAGTQDNKDSNHMQAWANADEERRIAVQPDLEMMCWAWTRLAYWDLLEAEGVANPELYRLWFDLSAAAIKSNLQEDARQASDRGIIGPMTTRKLSGFKETDKPTDDEYINWVGMKVQDPYLMLFNRPGTEGIDWDKVKPDKSGPAADSPADTPQAGPGEGQPGSPDDNETDTPRSQRPA